MSNSLYKRGVVQAIIAGGFLSTAGIGMRLLDAATPLQVAMYRAVGLAFFMFFVVVIRRRGHVIEALTDAGMIGVFAGLAFAAASWCVIFALANTTVANVMFIVSLAPCCAAVLGWILLRERVSKRTWLAIGIAICGVFIMINGGVSAQGLKGMAYAFGMATAYGLFTVLARMGKSRDMLPAVFWSGVFLALACALMTDDFSMTNKDFAICLGLGVFQVGLGGLLIVLASQHVPAAQISMVGGAVILFAIGFLALAKNTNSEAGEATLR